MKKEKEVFAPIVSDFLRVGMWKITNPVISKIEEGTNIPIRIFHYGSGESAGAVVVHGTLTEEDRGVFLLLSSMNAQNNGQGVHGFPSDISKLKGSKNPWKAATTEAIKNSIEKLLDVCVRIKPNAHCSGVSAGFKLVTGKLEKPSGEFHLFMDEYFKVVRLLNLYEVNLSLPIYFQTKSPVVRSLRIFLQTQQLLGTKRGYSISLLKLCSYIGYEPQEPIFKIWQVVNKAIGQLKSEGFLSSQTKRDYTHNKTDGGIIHFFGSKNAPKEINHPPKFILWDNCKYERRKAWLYSFYDENSELYIPLEAGLLKENMTKFNWEEFEPESAAVKEKGFERKREGIPQELKPRPEEKECLYQLKFGSDFESKDICDDCKIWEKCNDYSSYLKTPEKFKK